MKLIILCGGDGIRLKNQLNYIPKGLVFIDNKPLIWHIMKRYSLFGFDEFVLALGKDGDKIRDYFLRYSLYTNDVEFVLGKSNNLNYFNLNQEENWKVTLVNTGDEAHTGSRIFRCKNYINDDDFMVTYSDCLSNVDINKLLKFHNSENKIATITGVCPPFRYGEFVINENRVVDYVSVSKLSAMRGYVNGGYMVFNKKIFNYLNGYNECTLESDVFKTLSKISELNVFKHDDFWQCLDNDREYEYLKKLSEENKRYWLIKK
ncbi:MAG: sugar phosphate nucleotidyltransferase [Candidatus Shapirobacteria bacterium]|nr:sugar phosphate nucleotidyltransferase [Candidatus Shapirobacteria bacterium]